MTRRCSGGAGVAAGTGLGSAAATGLADGAEVAAGASAVAGATVDDGVAGRRCVMPDTGLATLELTIQSVGLPAARSR